MSTSGSKEKKMASVAPSSQLSASPSGARRTVATYSSYQDAERAVDLLSDQKFPVERVAIVGTGLRLVEQVVTRVTTGRAALSGAAQGAFIGLFIALLFGLFLDGPEFFGLLAYSVITAAIFGAIFWAIAHAVQGGRRDFASVTGTVADSYELQADDAVAGEARRLLAA
jgi:membrane protein required for beta-lactamase induction